MDKLHQMQMMNASLLMTANGDVYLTSYPDSARN